MASDILAIIAIFISSYSIWNSNKTAANLAKRNEDKLLSDELLALLRDMQEQAAHFFLDAKKDRSTHHIYVAVFSSKLNIAYFLIHLLKEERHVIQEEINQSLSDLYLYATLNVEGIHKRKPEENAQQFACLDQAYQKCIGIIHRAFQNKYH